MMIACELSKVAMNVEISQSGSAVDLFACPNIFGLTKALKDGHSERPP